MSFSFTLISKGRPFSSTVSKPICNKISKFPLVDFKVKACFVDITLTTFPSTGATIFPSFGIIANPSPSIFCENTWSSTSSNSSICPSTGATISCVVNLALSFTSFSPEVDIFKLYACSSASLRSLTSASASSAGSIASFGTPQK